MILVFSGLLRLGSCGLGVMGVIAYVSVDGETKRVSVRVGRPSESCGEGPAVYRSQGHSGVLSEYY